jgi:D-3-phosphoglycerate dehydrogenase
LKTSAKVADPGVPGWSTNLIATPHIGGLRPPVIESQSLETVRQVERIVAGEIPLGAVNADIWTRRP